MGENLAKNIINGSNFAKFLGNCNQCNFFLKPAETNEVYKELMKLKAKKSCGDDKIQPKIVKENAIEFSPLITHISNLSFESGTVPSKLKLAKVAPIFKKNAREDPGNYRPISLLSSINKIMEKIMHKQLSKFLKRYEILYDYQFGFREGHSTTLALIEIVDNILYGMDHGKHVAGIYMDLSKAFDTVDHEILFQKLQHYGIRGLPLQWFKSYLTNRKQCTIANKAGLGFFRKKCISSRTPGRNWKIAISSSLFRKKLDEMEEIKISKNAKYLLSVKHNIYTHFSLYKRWYQFIY